jgi:DNA-binding CsgD family transcriptional regulator
MLTENHRKNRDCKGDVEVSGPPSFAPVERPHESGLLAEALAESLRGEGRAVIVSGPVASGKTELLRGLADRATMQGAVLIGAAGSALEKDYPFAVARQLAQALPLEPGVAQRLERLLDEVSFPEGTSAQSRPGGAAAARVHYELCSQILRLAERTPIVICIDDLHFADAPSVGFLLYLLRRIGTARVLLVLAEYERTPSVHPLLDAELDRRPSRGRIRLELLSPAAVLDLFRQQAGLTEVERLAAEAYAISGGNPLLVNALVEDLWAEARARSAERLAALVHEPARERGTGQPRHGATTVAGRSFRRGVLSCLYRMEPAGLEVVRVLAVLGARASAERLGELLDLGAAEVEQVLRALHDAGLLDDGCFRHPAVCAAVLESMSTDQRKELHHRIANLLHRDGAPLSEVARHLLAAGRLEALWALPTLLGAAEQAMACGEVRFALDCLKLAQRNSTGNREQAEVTALLTGLEWLLDPAAASRHIPWLAETLRKGLLRGRHALLAVRYFSWYGLPDEAAQALEVFDGPADAIDVDTAAQAWTAFTLLAFWYPGLRERAGSLSAWARDIPAIRSRLDGLDLLIAVLSGQEIERTVARAEQILRRSRLADASLESLSSAVSALIYAEQSEHAERWSRALLEQSSEDQVPIVYALLSSLLAQSAFQQGKLAIAEESSRLALRAVPPEGWGIAIGIPLATAIAANTALGRYEEAARFIDMPVPNAMFQTPAGLHYLHACGRYNLAVGRSEAALHAFRTCGELMQRWEMDLPGIVPWRVECAKALLQLGDQPEARRLLREALGRSPGVSTSSRAMALRVFAATLETRQRPSVLWEAANMAEAVGDDYESAMALADLGAVYQNLGQFRRARPVMIKAAQLAKDCAAEPLYQSLSVDHLLAEPDAVEVGADGAEDSATDLSDAERKVAALAAQGYLNREIAQTLFITVSTVEQHLTRIYRKLGVTRRLDLPARLKADDGGSRATARRGL